MRHPQTHAGFTLLEVMIVVGIIGILAFLAIPNFVKARENAQKSVCIENLGKIEQAKQIFGADHRKKPGDPVDDNDLFGPEVYIRKKPECPTGGSYQVNPIGTDAECSMGPSLNHAL